MKSTSAKDSNESLTHKAAEKILNEAISRALKAIWSANGIPARAGAPFQALDTEYGKRMLELLEPELRYDPQWTKLQNIRKLAEKAEEQTSDILEIFHPRGQNDKGVATLFLALVDPRFQAQLKANQIAFKKQGAEVITLLDGLLSGNKHLLDTLHDAVIRVDGFLGTTKPRGAFDRVLGTGSLQTARNDVCWSGERLLRVCVRLVDTRNAWARLTKTSEIKKVSLGALEDSCGMIR